MRHKLNNIKVYQYADVPKNAPPKPEDSSKLLPDAVDLRVKVWDTPATSLKEDMAKLSNQDHLFYIYTSGTTGLPKAAIINHIRYFVFHPILLIYLNYFQEMNHSLYSYQPLHHRLGSNSWQWLCI